MSIEPFIEATLSNPHIFPPFTLEFRPVLAIDPNRFLAAYNLDVSEWVERHRFRESNQKGGNQIKYLSHSHALRLMRQHFPELETGFVQNPLTGGYFFREIDDGGYFCLPFVHDGFKCSAVYHFGVLSQSGAAVFPKDRDKNEKLVADEQLFNRSFYRAQTKAIALTTGIGLKLWTGDDLSEEIIDEKLAKIIKVQQLAETYNKLAQEPYKLPELDYASSTELINSTGRELQQLLNKLSEDSSRV